jgi:beta-galactosidase
MMGRTFQIGNNDFMLDGNPFQVICGEIHFARVPRDYWRHRLKMCRAMGLNTVCAYLFWNLHEWTQGRYDWSGQADAAAFCRIAKEEGLWVILRPGPYACAEWEMGGMPWWLLKHTDVRLRSSEPTFMEAATAWIREVGRELGPLQVTHGGPILMAQVENEYGSYGDDADYMGLLRSAMLSSGFDVPLFACNPVNSLRRGYRKDLFQVVNFARDPERAFKALREVQPDGPLMCGEFYPGWFDTWGTPHHLGDTDRYLADLEYMLLKGASFSLYMAHGGTTFGMWSGTDRPFKPDTSSYDYDAPISETGRPTAKFQLTRDLIARCLKQDSPVPPLPPAIPSRSIPEFILDESTPLLKNLPTPVEADTPRNMEAVNQAQGCILYRTRLPAGAPIVLTSDRIADFGWIFLEGRQVGVLDRRRRLARTEVPARPTPATLDILVEAMGRINFGHEVHDRKGLLDFPLQTGRWQIFPLELDPDSLAGLMWKKGCVAGPAFWRGHFTVAHPTDTFLDLRTWGKGVIWINGRCLARFWNIGPSQTAYLPAPWIRKGHNEVVILDLLGPSRPALAGLEHPIMDQLRPELDFNPVRAATGTLMLAGMAPAHSGEFSPGPQPATIHFAHVMEGRQFCLESISAHDDKPFAAVAELELLDDRGAPLPQITWTVAYADSEELTQEDGSATNAIDGQITSFWHTERTFCKPDHPHRLVVDLGRITRIGGFRYTPRTGNDSVTGRIRKYAVYVGSLFSSDP